VRYSYRAAGLALDIDVYFSPSDVHVNGGDAALAAREYTRARHAAGGLRGIRLLHEGTAPFGTGGTLEAREAFFSTRGVHGAGGSTYLWVTASRGRLIDLRLDVAAGFEDEGRVARSEVLAALGDVLARASDVGTAPRPSRLNVAMVWDPATPEGERDLWTIYLYTRAAEAASESADHALLPGEREASFEEEVRARRMAVNAFRYRIPQRFSAYFADLDRVEASGFLREYVWRYLHAP